MRVKSVKPRQLIEELAEGNPTPEESWFQRDYFDPTYGASELRAAARSGLIELDDSGEPEKWRFRLTPKARGILAVGATS